METILSFFSNLVLFTAGIVVLVLWVCVIVFIIDEAIDLILTKLNKSEEER